MDEDLADNLAALDRAARLPAKQRNIDLSIVSQEVAEYAYTSGLENEELLRIVNIVTTKTYLDQTTTTTLVKNLYPIRRIPSDAVVAVIGALGTSKAKPSSATQVLLVKWLGLVTDVLAEPAVLQKFYGVLFDLLDMISLRTALCYVLSLITRRKHIRRFRVQRLLELCQQTGNDPALVGLLQVYKNYLPEIITGNVAAKRFSFATQANIEWKKHLQAIQKYASAQGATTGSNGFSVQHAQTRSSLLTDVHTYHAEEDTVTLEEIQNVQNLVDNLEKIDPPSQIVTALRDPLLQRYLALKPSKEVSQRIRFWLSTYYEDELELLRNGFGVSPTLTEVLNAVLAWTETTRTLDVVSRAFLQQYVPLSQGEANTGLLLDLLAYRDPVDFSTFRDDVVAHLERSVMGQAETPFHLLLDFYTRLASNWLTFLIGQEKADANDSMLRATRRSYIDLSAHVSTIALSAVIASEKCHSQIMNFYDTQASLILSALEGQSNVVPILLPPPQIIYRLTFSSSLADFTAICTLLSTYKQICALAIRNSTTHADGVDDILFKTRQFNSHLMDTVNLLWRSKALTSTSFNVNSEGQSQNQDQGLASETLVRELQTYTQKLDRDYSIGSFFGLPFNGLTSGVARDTMTRLEEKLPAEAERHAGPASALSLKVLSATEGLDISWKDFRVAALDLLAELGAPAVGDFIFANMKDLRR